MCGQFYNFDIINFFASLPPKASKDQELLLSYLYLKKGDAASAKNVDENIISGNPNTSLAVNAMTNEIYIDLYNENNLTGAVNIFNNMLKNPQLSTKLDISNIQDEIDTYARIHGKTLPKPGNSEYNLSNVTSSSQYKLFDNYPNPFNPTTIINYQIPNNSFVTLKIYDELGREIRTIVNQYQTKGRYDISFNAENLASGIYFYKLQTGNFVSVKKMMLLK